MKARMVIRLLVLTLCLYHCFSIHTNLKDVRLFIYSSNDVMNAWMVFSLTELLLTEPEVCFKLLFYQQCQRFLEKLARLIIKSMSPICNDFVRIQSLPKIIILLAISIACWMNLKDYFFLFLKKTYNFSTMK